MTSTDSGGVMSFVQPIPHNIFFSRQKHSQRFKELYKDIEKQVLELLSTCECFKEDDKEKDLNGIGPGLAKDKHGKERHTDRHFGHGHGHSHNHNNTGSQRRHHVNSTDSLPHKKVLCYTERVARDICSNLNKLNKSNFRNILDKIMRMTSQANVDQITLLILSKAIQEDVYTDLYIEILGNIVKKFHSQKSKIQDFYDKFQESIDTIINMMSKLDYDNYNDFCQFGLLKEEIMNRQKILFLLIDREFELRKEPVDLFKSFFIKLLEHLVIFSNTNNQHMTGVILTIFDMLIKYIYTNIDNARVDYKMWDTLERDAITAMVECKKCINCKKNEFHIENLMEYINSVRNDKLQISDSQRAEETSQQ